MAKSVVIPMLNHEYKAVIAWGDLKHLRKTLIDHHYSPDIVTMTMLEEQTTDRRGVTFRESRWYPTIWVDSNLPAHEAIGTLAHEGVDGVDFMFEAIDENMYHSEIFAHSVGAIVRESIKAMGLAE